MMVQRIMSMFAACAVAVAFHAGPATADEEQSVVAKPSPEHEFLKKFAGEWEFEGEAHMEPGMPPIKSTGTMSGRMIGDFWAVVLVEGDMAGYAFVGQGMYGYDSQKKRYIGTWSDSASEFLWHYDGSVEGNKLLAHSQGPNPQEPGKTMKTLDTWDFQDEDTLVLTGQVEGPDGKLSTMMTATCKRVK